jgi:predicted transcriptional regulator of viral defense system
MNIFEFKKKIEELPCFETKELRLILADDFTSTTLVNLKNWVNKGYLIMLRRGLYIASELKNKVDMIAFATKIYPPSYVSMEMALNFYGIIPEAVFTATSVTTRKTKQFSTPVGNFSYQKIKKEAFGGFETRKQEGVSFNLALPEKALVDFFYLNRNILNGEREQFQGYRFNEEFKFDADKLLQFSEVFKNKKTVFLTKNFIKYYVAK